GTLAGAGGSRARGGGRVRREHSRPARALREALAAPLPIAPRMDSADPRMQGLDGTQAARLHAAARAMRDGAPAHAEALLQEAIAATGGHPEALRLLGLLRNRARRPAQARELFLRALAQRPDDAVLLSDLGSAQMNLGDA